MSNIRQSSLFLFLVAGLILWVSPSPVSAQGPTGSPGAGAEMPGGAGMAGMPGDAGDMAGGPGGFVLPTEIPQEIESVIKAAVYVDSESITTAKGKIAGINIDKKIIKGAVIKATESQESGVYVKNGGSITIEDSTISKPTGPFTYGVSESGESGPNTLRAASSYGLNAVVLSNGNNSKVTLKNVKVRAMGSSGPDDVFAANGVFATFNGVVYMNNVEIKAEGRAGHGLDGTSGGTFYIDTAKIITTGNNGSALTTDNPGGNIYAMNVTATVSGQASAGIYCDGGSVVSVSNSSLESKNDVAMVICNNGIVTLNRVKLTGRQQAVKVHFRRDTAQAVILNSNLVSTEGEGILIDGGCGDIIIVNTKITAAKGKYLVKSQEGSSDKGTGEGMITVRDSRLTGLLGADSSSILKLSFENSTLTGAVDLAGVSLSPDSRWNITAGSKVIELEIADRAAISASKPVTVAFGSSGTIRDGEKIGNVTFVRDTSLVYPKVTNMGMEAMLMGRGAQGGDSPSPPSGLQMQ